MYSLGSNYNNIDFFDINSSDEYKEIIFSQQSTGDNEFIINEDQNNKVSKEEENPVEEEVKEKKKPVEEEPKKEEKLTEKKSIEEHSTEEKSIEEKLIEKNSECKNDKNILTKKKRKREKNIDKDNNNKIRRDNLFKQVKIHSIKFVIDTINDIAEKENINPFKRLNKNKIKNDIKTKVKKSFNFKILDMTIRKILEVDDYNKNIIDYFEKNIKNEKSLKLINGFLDKTLFEVIEIFNMSNEDYNNEVIKIFNMSNEEYNNEFQSNNKFLLFQKKIKNKEKLIELIIFGVKDYLALKKERNRKID